MCRCWSRRATSPFRSSAWPTRRWARAASGCGRRCGRWAWRCRRSASRVNLSPADLAKEGSHYDLPIALALLAAMGVIPKESLAEVVALGELALDGSLTRVPGVLPAALPPRSDGRGLICPAACGGEAAWAGEHVEIVARARRCWR